MAIIFGKPSKYLKGMAAIHTAAGMGYLLISAYIVWIVFVKNQSQFKDPIGVLALFIVFGPLFAFAYWQYKKHDYGANSFLNGLSGERTIAVELKRVLNDQYAVFCDVNIPDKYSNIDYVIVGPSGIFTLEVKSHRGSITFDGNQLLRNGKAFEKDILKQTMAEALSLHDYLRERLGIDIFIKPALVFSNYTDLHFGLKPVKNIPVIRKAWIKELLESYPSYSYPTERPQVEQVLSLLVASQEP